MSTDQQPHLLYLTDESGENPQRLLTIVDLTAIESLIGGKADVVHVHTTGDVSGLQAVLNSLDSSVVSKLPIDFASYLVANVSAGYDPSDTDRFTVDVTWVYLDPSQNYPQQTFVNPIPVASDDHAGLMSKSDVLQLRLLTQGYESLRGQGVYVGQSFSTKADLDTFEIPTSARANDWTTVQADETKDGNTARYVIVDSGTPGNPILSFAFERILVTDAIGLAQTGIAGLVVGASDNGQNAGKGYIETDGTVSIIGWNDFVSNTGGHIGSRSNPHEVTKSQVGLGDVDNTADIDKPISSAQAVAFSAINASLESLIAPNVTPPSLVVNGDTGDDTMAAQAFGTPAQNTTPWKTIQAAVNAATTWQGNGIPAVNVQYSATPYDSITVTGAKADIKGISDSGSYPKIYASTGSAVTSSRNADVTISGFEFTGAAASLIIANTSGKLHIGANVRINGPCREGIYAASLGEIFVDSAPEVGESYSTQRSLFRISKATLFVTVDMSGITNIPGIACAVLEGGRVILASQLPTGSAANTFHQNSYQY